MGCCCCPDPVPGSVVTEELCGNFSLTCGSTNLVYNRFFTTTIIAGTVSLFAGTSCDGPIIITVTPSVGTPTSFDVAVGNTEAATFADIDLVQITCPDGTGGCTGKWCITLIYTAPPV